MELLRLEGLSFRFAGTRKALFSNIALTVNSGDRILLFGDSGSGKSTLLAVMAALAPEYVGGQLTGIRELRYARKGVVLQNPEAQIITPTVEEEIAFPLENQGMEPALIRQKVGAQLVGFQLEALKARLPLSLSGGECQRISLAAAMVQEPEIIFLDEPTSYLDEDRARQFFLDLEKLPPETAVMLVEHRFELAAPFCGKWYRLAEETLKRQDRPPSIWVNESDPRAVIAGSGEPEGLLRVQGLYHRYPEVRDPILRDVSFSLGRGQILAIQGPSGSGKTTILKKIITLLESEKGTIFLWGKDIKSMKEADYYRRLAYIPQNPEHLFVADTVREELKSAGPTGLDLAERFHLVRRYSANPWKLSEGEKRRLTLCVALALERDLIVMDEPTYGLDQEARKELAAIIPQLLDAGKSLLIVSHDSPFLRNIPCRILRLSQGRLSSGDSEEDGA
jgi:energy-coupling factor transport system ATP-binding protein